MPTDTITVPDALQSDDLGEGTGVILIATVIQNVLFYRTGNEEILSISAPTYTVSENAGSIAITYERQNPRGDKALQFNITLTAVTAILNQNYTLPTLPYQFIEDELLITKSITILNTHMGVGISKTFKVTTSVPPNRRAYTRGHVSEAVITITGVA